MSGQDYPIKNLKTIKSFFEKHKGTEFIEYMSLPTKKWEQGTYDRFTYYRLNDKFDYNTQKGHKTIERLLNYKSKSDIKDGYRISSSTYMVVPIGCL